MVNVTIHITVLLVTACLLLLYNLKTLGVNTYIYILTYLGVNRQQYLHDFTVSANTLYWVSFLPQTCMKTVIVSLFKLDSTLFIFKKLKNCYICGKI